MVRQWQELFYNKRYASTTMDVVPDFVDLAKVGGTEMDDIDFGSMMKSVERAKKEGTWLVFVGHDILSDKEKPRQKVRPETLDRLCAYCADPQNGIWVDTFSQVARVVRDYQKGL